MVTNHHQVAHVVSTVDRPGGVRQYHGVNPQELEDADREGDLVGKRKQSG